MSLKKKPKVVRSRPPSKYELNQRVSRDIEFGYVDPLSKDYRPPLMTTGIANTNPMNMALSCRVLNEFHYSSPPINGSNTQQVVQGYARGQPRGLAYTHGHPLNSKLLNMPSNFFGNLPNPINP